MPRSVRGWMQVLCTAELPHPLLAGVCTDLGAIIPFSPRKILFQGTKYVKCVTKAETDLEENRKFNFYISFLLSSFGRKGLLSALGIKVTLCLLTVRRGTGVCSVVSRRGWPVVSSWQHGCRLVLELLLSPQICQPHGDSGALSQNKFSSRERENWDKTPKKEPCPWYCVVWMMLVMVSWV